MKVTLEGKDYILDLDKIKELGLIKEDKKELIERKDYEKEYFRIDGNLNVHTEKDTGSSYASALYDNGNYYSSREVAQDRANSVGSLTGRIITYMLESNTKNGWRADFNNRSQDKYFVILSDYKYIHFQAWNNIEYIGIPYTTKETASELCKLLNEGVR